MAKTPYRVERELGLWGYRMAATVEGLFLKRPNRFLCIAKVGGREVPAFLPNPGRLEEILLPGAVLLLKEPERKLKTSYHVVGAYLGRRIVSLDSRLPNKLFRAGLSEQIFHEFQGYTLARAEQRIGNSRIDFLLKKGEELCFVEVKSVTLVKNGVALFPDAPTERGLRQVIDMAKIVKKNKRKRYQCCVYFIIQREDAMVFQPNWERDPKFSSELVRESSRGMKVHARKVKRIVDIDSIELGDSIPAQLHRPS